MLCALYGWFIRPIVAGPTWQTDAFSGGSLVLTNHENWLRLGWYLSPLGLGLAVLGSCLLLWRVQWKSALLLAVGFLFAAVYLWNVRANPHQVYVMRRYVPVVAPFFIFAAAYLLGDLLQRARHLQKKASSWAVPLLTAAMVLSVIWLAGLGWSARGFVSQIDHQGLLTQLVELNQQLPPESILLFNDQSPVSHGDRWGTPLKYIFGHDIFTLRDLDSVDDQRLAESIKSWQNNGRAVIWIGDPTWLVDNGFQFQEQQRQIQSRRLESSYEHKPLVVVPETWTFTIATIEEE